jgi:hypothetical protein
MSTDERRDRVCAPYGRSTRISSSFDRSERRPSTTSSTRRRNIHYASEPSSRTAPSPPMPRPTNSGRATHAQARAPALPTPTNGRRRHTFQSNRVSGTHMRAPSTPAKSSPRPGIRARMKLTKTGRLRNWTRRPRRSIARAAPIWRAWETAGLKRSSRHPHAEVKVAAPSRKRLCTERYEGLWATPISSLWSRRQVAAVVHSRSASLTIRRTGGTMEASCLEAIRRRIARVGTATRAILQEAGPGAASAIGRGRKTPGTTCARIASEMMRCGGIA